MKYSERLGTTMEGNNTTVELLSYEKINKTHYYTVRHQETGNEETLTWTTLRNGKFKDRAKQKALAKQKQIAYLKQRNNITKPKATKTYKLSTTDNTVLVLDLATYSTGWALIEDNQIVSSGTITVKGDDVFTRARQLVDQIQGDYDCIVAEDTYLGLNANILALLEQFHGMVSGMMGQPIHRVNIKSWKAHHKIKGTRPEQKQQAMVLAEQITNEPIVDDNHGDAVLIADYLLATKV